MTIPAGHPANLTFWLNITTSEALTTAYDFLYVEVRSTSGALLGTLGTFSNRNGRRRLVHAASRSASRAGEGRPSGSSSGPRPTSRLPTSFRIDDVSLS